MPRLSSRASKRAKDARMKAEMDKWHAGELHSGSAEGPVVTDQRQAIAIGLSESGQSKKTRTKKAKAKKRSLPWSRQR